MSRGSRSWTPSSWLSRTAVFDVVVAQYVITTVPNPEATLDEFARVLKPGGEIVLVSRVGAEAGLRRALEQWFAPLTRWLGWRTEFPWSRYANWAGRPPACGWSSAAPCRRSAISRSSVSPRNGRASRSRSAERRGQAAEAMRTALGDCRDLTPNRPRKSLWKCHMSFIEIVTEKTGTSMTGFLRGAQGAALGRPPLLPPQPDQPGAAPGERDQLPVRLCADVHATRPRRRWSAGWSAMTSRQAGHFFFEPKDYDEVNQATHEYKEEIKVGYNLQRKVVLMTIWALSPLLLYVDPTLFGMFQPHNGAGEFLRHVALIWLSSGWADCCSAPCSCSSSRTCRPGWSGRPRSSPTRSTTSSSTTRRRSTCMRGELIDPTTLSGDWSDEDRAAPAVTRDRTAGSRQPSRAASERSHLPQDPPPDRFVGRLGVGPPPAVLAASPWRRRRSGPRPPRSRHRCS